MTSSAATTPTPVIFMELELTSDYQPSRQYSACNDPIGEATGMRAGRWEQVFAGAANRRAVELGAQSRTGVWPSVFPGIGRPGSPASPRRRALHCCGQTSPLGYPARSWKGPGVFVLFGPVYLRESQVAEIFGVSERQVAAWHAAGLLRRQQLVSFPGGYGYRRSEVVGLANAPGPAAAQVREQMYQEHKERCAGMSAGPLQARPESTRAPR